MERKSARKASENHCSLGIEIGCNRRPTKGELNDFDESLITDNHFPYVKCLLSLFFPLSKALPNSSLSLLDAADSDNVPIHISC